MVAITTKYLGPTNTRGSRIVANANGYRVTVSYDCSLSQDGNHANAARQLCIRMKWQGQLIGGHTNKGMVWVFPGGPVVSV